MLYVVSYDISDDRRRDRVANALLDFGVRVQFSVFECHLERPELTDLQARLQRLLKDDDDRVRYYRICADCEKQVVTSGPDGYSGENAVIIV